MATITCYVFVGTVRLTNPFGSGHRGQDIVAVENVTILAARDGVVTVSDRMPDSTANSYGEWVEIRHTDGTYTRYAHMSLGSRKVTVGQSVVAGQPIGIMGSTGNSSGPHLHFEYLASDRSTLLDPSPMSGVPNVRGTYENDYEPGTIIPPEPPEPGQRTRRRTRRIICARRF